MYILDVFQANIENKIIDMDRKLTVRRRLGKQRNYKEPSQTSDQALRWGKNAKNGLKYRSKKKNSASEAVDWGGGKGSVTLSPP